MTRRRVFARRPLNMQQYIHRATVGLPKTERLDAAAELRTHLVERVNSLRAEGHPAAEAEYLAVQAMGDPAPTNRGLLGHAFTHRAGWAVLAAVLLGGGGWAGYGYAEREWMPPREGIQYSGDLTLDDLKALNADDHAPRGVYQTATLTYPKGTKSIFYLLVTPSRVVVQQKDVAGEVENNLKTNELHSIPGSYRYQERWLMTEMRSETVCPGRWELYFNVKVLPTRLIPLNSSVSAGLTDLPWSESTKSSSCTGVLRQFRSETRNFPAPGIYTEGATSPVTKIKSRYELFPQTLNSVYSSGTPEPLQLRRWRVLRQVVLNPRTASNGLPTLKGKTTGMYVAVLPSSEKAAANAYWDGQHDQHGRITFLENGLKSLPFPPQLDDTQTSFIAR